jgi:hypothetical protein
MFQAVPGVPPLISLGLRPATRGLTLGEPEQLPGEPKVKPKKPLGLLRVRCTFYLDTPEMQHPIPD